jgi:mycothione reductase
LVGRAGYAEVARGQAMQETEGFVKVLVHRKDGLILGCHIIGPQASILIQEVVNAMTVKAGIWGVVEGMHIHPALPEVVTQAFGNLAPAGRTR